MVYLYYISCLRYTILNGNLCVVFALVYNDLHYAQVIFYKSTHRFLEFFIWHEYWLDLYKLNQ